ncbi:M23 family metallopeptidase [Massilia sp. S19_KUP03_FR1]|uniref:M23 family metallopeptidase n=1 Tax=Massilia sp. S19_KUP03_FR1 TaxID=3025503 RepID=UPI002FCD86E5
MKWLLTLIIGAVLGAAGLFVYLRQVPHDAAPGAVVTPGTTALPAPAVAPAPNSAAALNGQLPPAPVVAPDLTEADLPVRPSEPVPMPAVNGADAPAGKLLVPVDGVKFSQLSDTYNAPRGSERQHEALDIMAPKGTKVFAVADGKVAKLFNSVPGGLTVYQFEPAEKFAYYYAHLDKYADGIKEGQLLKRGDLIGYVGVTGNSDPKAPHLHFAVVQLTPEKQWWKGTPVNPYPLMAE